MFRTELFPTKGNYGIYIHLPFCNSKCPYCHFTSMTGGEALFERYYTAICRELELRGIKENTQHPRTIYIGGGTPSLVPAPFIESVLGKIAGINTLEVSIEANPESLTQEWLEHMRAAGVNRLSIGIQSLDNLELQTLGRIHNADQALKSLRSATEAGFDNISADIIFGIPGQTITSLCQTLETLVATPITHISCYGLSIEEDTTYWELFNENLLHRPDPDSFADMYLKINSYLAEHGYSRYELSNFSRPGYTCLHNQAYWDYTPYLGIGVSAHSFDGKRRFWNTADVIQYMSKLEDGNDPVSGVETIDQELRLTEEIMLSLRTERGISQNIFNTLPETSVTEVRQKINDLTETGFMEQTAGGSFKLTTRGAVLADEIIAELAALIT